MATATQRAASSRGRTRGRSSSSAQRSSSRSTQRKASTSRSGSSQTKNSSQRKRPTQRKTAAQGKTATQRKAATQRKTPTTTSRQPSSNGTAGANANHNARETFTSIGVPIATATIGVAGGILLGRTALQRGRKLLGIPLPAKIDLANVTQQLGEAGRQFGKLAGEVRSVREKAEQVGRAIS